MVFNTLIKIKMKRFAIKHKPSGKFLYEDEGGAFLVDESDAFVTFGNKKDADEMFNYLEDIVFTEDGEFPVEEFEVASL
jgi:hypothetical protein